MTYQQSDENKGTSELLLLVQQMRIEQTEWRKERREDENNLLQKQLLQTNIQLQHMAEQLRKLQLESEKSCEKVINPIQMITLTQQLKTQEENSIGNYMLFTGAGVGFHRD